MPHVFEENSFEHTQNIFCYNQSSHHGADVTMLTKGYHLVANLKKYMIHQRTKVNENLLFPMPLSWETTT